VASLWLSRLNLTAFRNHRSSLLEPTARPVLLTGPNGAGKTNLLEAVSLLAPGRGLRWAKTQEIQARASDAPWAVAAVVETAEGPRRIGTGRDPAAAGQGAERRVLRLDGRNERSQAAFSRVLDVLWLTPQMDGLWREGADERRRFLDRLVFAFDPAHAGRVSGYENSLRQRARLLQDGSGEAVWLSALEETMAERGVAIEAARSALVARLLQATHTVREAAFPKCGLELSGVLNRWLAEGSALEAEERLRAALFDGRGRDAEQGGSGVGPHRSDLVARHLGKDCPAALCSTGEQKVLLVGLILAHARLVALERGRPPLLLLDEVAAHLDAARREALYDEILSLGLQAWLTGTEPSIFEGLLGCADVFQLAEGRLSEGRP